MPNRRTADDDSESYKRTDVQAPQVCVDYLSYVFDEMDLAASWRMMTKQKNDEMTGIRLENASWRTWAKQRGHLKTISPETLDWLKDNDMTWLYGPLHTVTKFEQNDRYAPEESSTHDKLCLIHAPDPPLNDKCVMGTPSIPTAVTRIITPEASVSLSNTVPPMPTRQQQQQQHQPLKSAMKKITISDILRRSLSQLDINDLNNEHDVCSSGTFDSHRHPKLRFNRCVEQYRAVSDDDEDDEVYSSGRPISNMNTSDGTLVTAVDHHQQSHQHSRTIDDDNNGQLSIRDDGNGHYPYHSNEHDCDKPVIPQHHLPYDSNLMIPAHLTTRSIKRLEPTILKTSNSHLDTSLGSRDDCDDDADDDEKHSLDAPIIITQPWAKHSCDAPTRDNGQHSSGKSDWLWKRPTVESPSIFLRPRKSQPISQSWPIEAIPYHYTDTHPCHGRILDQQQQQQQQQQHLSSSSLLEILVKGLFLFMFGIHR